MAKSFSLLLVSVLGFGVVFAQATIMQFEDALNVRDVSSLIGDAGTREPVEVDPDDPLAGRDVNILLLGSDIRDGENVKLGGAPDVGGMRADVTILLHISADRTRIEALSFPRDLEVRIPDCQTFDGRTIRGWTDKMNVAFANGGRYGDPAEGAACVIKTLYELTGITIDHYVVLDFAGFRDMIDAVGGVPMCVPHRIESKKARLALDPGPQVLDGKTALGWVRARTGIGTGDGTDLARIERQQELMRNLATKVLDMNVLADAKQLATFTKATAESMFVDEGLGSLTHVVGLGLSLMNFDADNLTFVTVPWRYPTVSTGNIELVEVQARPLFEAVKADQPLPDTAPKDPTKDAKPATDSKPATEQVSEPAPPKPAEPAQQEQPKPIKRIPHPEADPTDQELLPPSLWDITEQINQELLRSC